MLKSALGLSVKDHQVCDIEGKLNKQPSLLFSAAVSEGTHETQGISRNRERWDISFNICLH